MVRQCTLLCLEVKAKLHSQSGFIDNEGSWQIACIFLVASQGELRRGGIFLLFRWCFLRKQEEYVRSTRADNNSMPFLFDEIKTHIDGLVYTLQLQVTCDKDI